MISFRQYFRRSIDFTNQTDLLTSRIARNTVRFLLTISFVLIGLGIVVILFPLILALLVAGLLFFIAMVCLYWAGKTYLHTRNLKHVDPDIKCEIYDPGDDVF